MAIAGAVEDREGVLTLGGNHGYIENDFDVHEWAAPEFAEEAAKQLLEEEWTRVVGEKLGPDHAHLGIEHPRLG